MDNFIKKIECVLEKTNEDIEKLKFEALKEENDESNAKKIEIISKYYQTIISSSIIFNHEIEEKVKYIFDYKNLNDDTVVYYSQKKRKMIEVNGEATPKFRIKGAPIESATEVDCDIKYDGRDPYYDQFIINIPKKSKVKKQGRVIISDDEATPNFRIKGVPIESATEATPSFRIKGVPIESATEATPKFVIKDEVSD